MSYINNITHVKSLLFQGTFIFFSYERVVQMSNYDLKSPLRFQLLSIEFD